MHAHDLPDCPVEITLLLISNKWRTLILRDLMGGTKRFSDLKRTVRGISQKVLTKNLREMEADGILTRKVYPVVPPRTEYTLTALGQSLRPVLDALDAWGRAYRASLTAQSNQGFDP